MASTLEKSIRNAAEKLAQLIEEGSILTIRTYITVVNEGTSSAEDESRVLVAETTISAGGDYTMTIPAQRSAAGLLERDDDLLTVHQQSVQAAIDYRTKSLNALLTIIK